MFSALASMIMAAKVHCTEIKSNLTKKNDQQVSEIIYRNKIDKIGETEKYEKSRLPESGYMTVAEYEAKSRAKTKKEISAKILDKADIPKDENMVYVPQHRFKLVKYNDPAGTPELSLPRKLNFDRQINAQGIVSGDYTKMVYPAVYYYAQSDCTSCDLFLINLDPSLTNIEKVQKANVVNKEPKPLISTSKDINTKFIFRTLTPIDFSSDNKKLMVKEKIGHRHDGIWKTELWIYDFDKKEGKKLPQLRDAIVHYWINKSGVDFDEKRWDIYPLGFDAKDDNRAIVCAYAYTGDAPQFLGTWSIDVNGEDTRLEDLSGISVSVTANGYRLAEEENVIPVSQVEFEAKQAAKAAKQVQKLERDDKKFDNEQNKIEYERKIHQMDMETLLKIKARKDYLKQNKAKTPSDGITGD